jgi:hypothetical protein
MKRLPLLLASLVLLASGLTAHANAADRYALIVSGASGSKEVAENQQKWRVTLAKAMRTKEQIPLI